MSADEAFSGIARRTLAHYEAQAIDYEAATRDHDVEQNIAALLRHVVEPDTATILDFGCGPGRDLKRFAARGLSVVGLDGSANFVRMAREASGAPVWHQDFFALDLPAERFDGVFANATLQHVPSAILPRVLGELRATLKPDGVLLASIPRGDNEEGWNGSRYGTYHDLAGWRGFMTAAGFVELEHYYRPTDRPFDEQRWLVSVWRKARSSGSAVQVAR